MSSRYGICDAQSGYQSNSQPILTELANAGVFWLRADWEQTSNFISWINSLKALINIKVLAILDYAIPHSTLAQWTAAVTAAVQSIPSVDAWEIWNEPDLAQFQSGYMDGTPQHYYDMLKAAYPIIRANSPNSKIAGPAISGSTSFLQSIVNLGALNYLDIVSWHMYPQYGSYNASYWNTCKSIAGSKTVWITETGYSTYPIQTYTEAMQNSNLNQIMGLSTRYPADVIFWYTLMEGEVVDWEGSFGIVKTNGTKKQAYNSFKAFLSPPPIVTHLLSVLSLPSGITFKRNP